MGIWDDRLIWDMCEYGSSVMGELYVEWWVCVGMCKCVCVPKVVGGVRGVSRADCLAITVSSAPTKKESGLWNISRSVWQESSAKPSAPRRSFLQYSLRIASGLENGAGDADTDCLEVGKWVSWEENPQSTGVGCWFLDWFFIQMMALVWWSEGYEVVNWSLIV